MVSISAFTFLICLQVICVTHMSVAKNNKSKISVTKHITDKFHKNKNNKYVTRDSDIKSDNIELGHTLILKTQVD